MTGQLSLPVRLADDAGFDNFHIAGQNQLVVAELLRYARELRGGPVFLHGPTGCGRSHLLQAACQSVLNTGGSAVYLPLAELRQHAPDEVLAGLEGCALVGVDDIDAIAGSKQWEEALFHWFNRCRESGTAMLFAARLPPQDLGLGLVDMRSRLASGVTLQLQSLDDEQKLAALRLRAHGRGMVMDAEVAAFILLRAGRDMPALMKILDTLDTTSLDQGRRLSIPFVKQALGW